MSIQPRTWSWVVAVALAALALGLWLDGRQLAAATGAVTAVAWLLFGAVPHADRYTAARIAGLTAAATIVVTWTSAMLAALLYATYVAGDASARVWIPITLLAATNFGGLLAVFRSAQTRTETSAALREVSELRIAVLSAPSSRPRIARAARRHSRS